MLIEVQVWKLYLPTPVSPEGEGAIGWASGFLVSASCPLVLTKRMRSR